MSLVLCLPCNVHLCKSSSNVPCLPSFLGLLQNPHVCEGAEFIAPAAQTEGPTSKSDANICEHGVFTDILTSSCASHHSRVRFLKNSTSKNASKLRCFQHFDFKMCFAPKPLAIFQQLHVQMCSGNEVILSF